MTIEERVKEAVGAIERRFSRLEVERIIHESILAAYDAGAETEREECAQIAAEVEVERQLLKHSEGALTARIIQANIRARGK